MRTRWWSSALAAALPLSLVACPGATSSVVVTLSDVKQPVDGFGASSAFFGGNISDAQADLLFDAKKGIGLSLLRIMVGLPNDTQSDGSEPTTGADPVATAPEIGTAQQAVARGCKVWAAAWTPPPIWKTTNSRYESGTDYDSNSLLYGHYQDFANYLADFVHLLSTANPPVSLYGLSPANEPDVMGVVWDGTLWSPQELTMFIGQYMAPTFAVRWPSVRIIAPETVNCYDCDTYVAPLLADPTASSALSIVATHGYAVTNPITYAAPAEAGKPFWQTEWSTENRGGVDTPDPSMTNAITMATQIHNYMTTTQVSSWSFWAIYATWDDFDTNVSRENPALIQSDSAGGAPYAFKRAYALGNWSKFVRPGFVRIGATDTPAPGVLVEAYRDDSGHIAIVVVNTTSSSVTEPFTAAGGTFGTMTPWVTDPNNNLVAQSPIVATSSFFFALPPTSVVTFVNWDATTLTPGLTIPEIPDAGADATQTHVGDTSSLDCADPVTPDNLVSGGVTDFTDWAGSTGKWGSPNGLYGAVYAYSGPKGSMVSANVDTSNNDLHVTGSVAAGDYGGAGLAFFDCATVASFSQVQFTVSGSAPGCELDLQIKTFDQQPSSQTPPGGCSLEAGSCYNFPTFASIAVPTSTAQTITSPLSSFSTWSSADVTQVVGLQWQFSGTDVDPGASCPIDVAITDIKFLSASEDGEAGMSAGDADQTGADATGISAGDAAADGTSSTGAEGAADAVADASSGGG